MELINKKTNLRVIKYIFIIFLSTFILTISAKIRIPFYPVPMTMQTFVILLIGITFGWRLGMSIVLVYILEGLLGLPVFSGTPEKGVGLVYFTGPTMGYIIGFIFAVYISGKFEYHLNKKGFLDYFKNFTKLLISVSFIYIFGLIWLGILIGWDKPLIDLGAKPFLLAELFKILILTLISNNLYKIRKLI